MASTETFWAPGVTTQIEHPDRVTFQRRFGWGLEVEQRADAAPRQNNWFHIGVPCRSRNHFRGGTIVQAYMLRMRVNENVRVAEIHLRDGTRLIDTRGVNFIDREVDEEFLGPPSPRHLIAFGAGASGITLCVRLEFLSGTPIGHAHFFGAGVRLTGLDD